MAWKAFFLALLLRPALSYAAADSTTVVVTADGYATMNEEDTIQKVRARAMKEAERNAIEQGTATYISSVTEVKNFQAVDDQVKALAAGYIVSRKVLADTLLRSELRYHVQIEARVKCGDLEKLIAAQSPPPRQEVRVEFNLIAERRLPDGTWIEVPVHEGSVLRSHDQFQVHLRPESEGYVYVLIYDSSGKASLLFPSEYQADNRVRPGTDYVLPQRGLFYELDEVPGTETIYLIASASSMNDLAWLLEKMEKTGDSGVVAGLLTDRMGSRGIAKVVPGRTQSYDLTGGGKVQKVTEVVQGQGAWVRKVSFEHR
jgi:hypothetical protein